MMSLKVSTSLDQNLFRKARREALRQGREVSEILEDALDRYLLERETTPGVVAASWATIPLSADGVQQILAEEDDLLDD
jgi:hypothetical protein